MQKTSLKNKKNSAKGNQEERLEDRNQKGHESKYAGLIFHHFFLHQRIFEGLMQRMMSSQSFHETNKEILSFVRSKLDLCNSLLFGAPKRDIAKL